MTRWRITSLMLSGLVLLVMIAAPSVPESRATTYTPPNGYRPKDFAVIQKGSIWHIFGIYVCDNPGSGCSTVKQGLRHLTSSNLNTWTEVGWVVPPGPAGSWDSLDIWAPSIVERNGTYYMFYAGVKTNQYGRSEQHIGLATSTDLNVWTKQAGNPVFDCSTVSWVWWDQTSDSGVECRDPFVTWDAAQQQWVMFYSTRSQHIDQAPVTGIANPTIIGLATSSDLLTWQDAGNILATAGPVSESAHVIEHAGGFQLVWTNNCIFLGTKCLKTATASIVMGPYSGTADLPAAGPNEYASEYNTAGGREYFARISNNNAGIALHEIAWTGGIFGLREIPYGQIGNIVWIDSNGDGIKQAGESGALGVRLRLYIDNGDNIFSASSDFQYAETQTTTGFTGGQFTSGYYTLSGILPGRYWLVTDATLAPVGGVIGGLHSTTIIEPYRLIVGDAQNDQTKNFGFAPPDTTSPGGIVDLTAKGEL